MAQDLVKQFSLDYLISGDAQNAPNAPASAQAPPDGVFQLLSQPILRKLETAPNRTLRVFELIDQLAEVYGEIRCEVLSEVLNRLEAAGRIRVRERHRHGNHEVQLV